MENQENMNTGSATTNTTQQATSMANPFGQQQLPNATAILVLGIISIVGCFCYGLPGLVCGIIALVLSGKANALYKENPSLYTEASFKNMKAGKVCAIIGLSLSALTVIIVIIELVIFGAMLNAMPWEMMGRH